MKDLLLKLFSVDSGVSSTRVMSVMCVCSAIFFALVALFKGSDLEKAAWVVTAFLVPAFGGKVLQKKYENLGDTSEKKDA